MQNEGAQTFEGKGGTCAKDWSHWDKSTRIVKIGKIGEVEKLGMHCYADENIHHTRGFPCSVLIFIPFRNVWALLYTFRIVNEL